MPIYDKVKDFSGAAKADEFLRQFKLAGDAMKAASDALLAVDRNAYGAAHKKMVRLTKEWNRIEHMREADKI